MVLIGKSIVRSMKIPFRSLVSSKKSSGISVSSESGLFRRLMNKESVFGDGTNDSLPSTLRGRMEAAYNQCKINYQNVKPRYQKPECVFVDNEISLENSLFHFCFI